MPATKVGIVYDVASRLVVCGIKPDTDAQLSDPAWVGQGQAMLVVPQAAYDKIVGTPAPFDQLLATAIGAPLVPDRYAVVDQTNAVVSVVRAVPSYAVAGHAVVPHATVNLGDTYVGAGAFTRPMFDAQGVKTGTLPLAATSQVLTPAFATASLS